MSFDELILKSRELTPQQVAVDLKTLSANTQFLSVLALIHRNCESFSRASANQKISSNHGTIAHAAGSHYAMQLLEDQLREIIDARPKPTGQQRPEEDDES